jgi:hypothetical protein
MGLTRVAQQVRGWKVARTFPSPVRWGAWLTPRLSPALSAGRMIARRVTAFDVTAALAKRRRRRPVSKRLLVLNVFLIGVSAVLLISVARTLVALDRLSPIPAPRPVEVAPSPTNDRGPIARASAGYEVIATRNLFDPSRSEPTRSGRAVQDAPPPAKPVLYGVVLSDDPGLGLAYFADPGTRRIAGYRVGDDLAGGRVERIEKDRVLIRRADELLEVFLSRSNAPRASESASASAEPGGVAVPFRRIPKD